MCGFKKFCEDLTPNRAKVLEKKGRKLGRDPRCEGPECSRVIMFRDEVFLKENAKNV